MSPEAPSVSTGVGADLMSSVAPDLFTGADTGDLGVEFTEGDGNEFAEGLPDEPAVEEPVIEEAPAEEVAEEEPPAEELPEAAAPADELPEGVRKGKDRNGKDGMWLTPQRYEQFHSAHRAIRDFEGVIGEAVTPNALALRERAYMGQERIYTDLNSGDPKAQGSLISHLFGEMKQAQADGLVGTNPIVPFTQEFYKAVKADPDAYANLRMDAARDLVNEMYQEAGKSQDANLWRSAGWIAKNLGLSFKPEAEMQNFAQQAADPLHQANTRIQKLESELSGRQTQDATAQFASWKSSVAASNTAALMNEAILPSIGEEQAAAWQKFPQQYQNLVVGPLNKAVREAISKDAGFNERIKLLDQSAQRATSAQARAGFAEQIKQAFVNRGRLAADAHKGQILKEAGALLKQQNQKTHERRQAARDQRSPQGTRAAVPRSLVPGGAPNRAGTPFNVHEAAADLSRLFAS